MVGAWDGRPHREEKAEDHTFSVRRVSLQRDGAVGRGTPGRSAGSTRTTPDLKGEEGGDPQRASSTGTPRRPLREGAQTCAPPLHTPVFPPGPAEQGARGTRADGCCPVGVLPKRGEGANRRRWETQVSAQGRPCRAARGEHRLSSRACSSCCYSAPLCRDLARVHPGTAP